MFNIYFSYYCSEYMNVNLGASLVVTNCITQSTYVGCSARRRHQMETFSSFLALGAGNSPVTSEFPTQRPVTLSFDVFSDFCLSERLGKQSSRRWFGTPWRTLWRHYKGKLKRFHIYFNYCALLRCGNKFLGETEVTGFFWLLLDLGIIVMGNNLILIHSKKHNIMKNI